MPKVIVCAGCDRRTQGRSANPDRSNGVLEVAETTNQQTFQKLTPEPIKHATKNETKTSEGTPPMLSQIKFFPGCDFRCEKGRLNKANQRDFISDHNFRAKCIKAGIQHLIKQKRCQGVMEHVPKGCPYMFQFCLRKHTLGNCCFY